MINSGSQGRMALVALVLIAVVHSGSADDQRLSSCCKTVSRQKITEPITGYLVQRARPPCVRAVIFQTESGLYCSHVTSPWVRRKIVAFEMAKAEAAAGYLVPKSPKDSIFSPETSTTPVSSSSSSTANIPVTDAAMTTPTSGPVSSSSSSSTASIPVTSEDPAGETFSEDM